MEKQESRKRAMDGTSMEAIRSGRLQEKTLTRMVDYGAAILALTDRMERDRKPRRIIDQLVGCGTSAGAQLFEASEALSKADFVKSVGWAAKELNETRYWLHVIRQRGWLPAEELETLLAETIELLLVSRSIIARCRKPRAT